MTDINWNNYTLETQAIRAGHKRTHEDEHSIPIFATSSYVFKNAEEAALRFTGQKPGNIYSRFTNPTVNAFQERLALMEKGERCLAFSSGMAAIHCVTMLLESGDHVVAGADIYGGTFRLLHQVVNRAGITVNLVNTSDPAAIEAAFSPRTRLLWIESPGNPLMSIADVAACATLAHGRNILLGVDNTFATPVLTRPLELGADIVMHSATKYLGGHSDVLGGALVFRELELFKRAYFVQNATGAVMGPLESSLCSRGIKTLELRVREQCRTAQRIAEFLAGDPRVSRVLYPGLPSHPGHQLAARQMDGQFGAMLSFELAADAAAAKRLVEATELFQLAVSLGAVESLIEQPALMSHASYDAKHRRVHGIGDSLVRLSIGLEAFEDLRDDLKQALARAMN